MALEHAILTSLAERAASGYDLTRRFDASIGFFWTASHQQIYRVLSRMGDDGWVVSTRAPGQGRRDRLVYELTDRGRDILFAWTTEPSRRDPLRSEFAVKVRASRFGDRPAVLADIRLQREEHGARLERFEERAARDYPDPGALGDQDLPAYLVLRGGIRSERAYVEWCEEMLAALDPT